MTNQQSGDQIRNLLASMPIPEFLDRLAGPEATPGGGSVAALAGALAAALVTMVGGLTAGKKGFEAVADEMKAIAEQGTAITERLTRAIDADAAAYDGVMAAFRLPKADEAQKAERTGAIQAAMKRAAEVPQAVAADCLAAAELAAVAMEKGNPNASSDAAVALLMALCGLEGAALNVATNLDAIKDADYVAATKGTLDRLFARAGQLRVAMWTTVRERIHSLPATVST
jgi:formiminotetrahydrofolate cyclodeaminase